MYCLLNGVLDVTDPGIVVVVVVVVLDVLTTGNAGGSTRFTTTVFSGTIGTVVVFLPFACVVVGAGMVPDTTCAKHSLPGK
jgi:hypothetical protein